MTPTRGEFVELYDGESGNVLFGHVAMDCVDELSSPGPKQAEVDYWIDQVEQIATDRQLKAYVKNAGATVPEDVRDIAKVALWIAACDYAEYLQYDEEVDDDEDDDDDDA